MTTCGESPHSSFVIRHSSFPSLHPSLADWFHGAFPAGFTEAQRLCLPHILGGRSVLLLSPTGSGKTLAGFLGVIDALLRERDAAPGRRFGAGIRALYVSPLRALTYDIQKNLERPLREMGLLAPADGDPKADGIRLGLRTGDTDARERARLRRRPPHLLLTTPESLAILLAQPAWHPALAACRFVVVDELHALAENKRGAHLSVSLERLERLRDRSVSPLVRVGLSATVGDPATAAGFLVGAGRPCAVAAVDAGRRRPELTVFSPVRGQPYGGMGGGGRRAGEILAETARRVRAGRSTVVFANTRAGAERFGLALRAALPALADQIEIHHGSLDRSVRLEVEDRLKNGELRAVVCSTSLEMGVDIGAVDLAVLLSPPRSVARTLQRVGRAGHAVGAVSRGVLMARGVDELLEAAVTAQLAREGRLEPLRVPENPLDVLAQHLVGLAMAQPGIPVAEARRVVTGAFPFRDLPGDEFLRVVEFLEGGGRSLARQYAETFGKLVRRPDPDTGEPGLWTTGKRVERDYLINVGTIATEGLVDVVEVGRRRRRVGSVDERFVQGLRRGDVFVLGGVAWRFGETDAASGAARVEPAAPGERPTVPAWSAARQSLPRGLAGEIAATRAELDMQLEAGADETAATAWLAGRLDLAPDNARAVVRQFLLQRRVSAVPRPGRIVVEIFRETAAEFAGPDSRRRGPTLRRGRRERAGLVPVALSHHFVHTGLGRAGNDALARIAAWRVNQLVGGNALAAADDGGFLLTLRREQELPRNAGARRSFARAGAADDLASSLRDSELVRGQFRAVAQTGLMVPRRLPGAERRVRHLRFSAEVLFKVLAQYEPDHPLLTEAYRQATHAFLDADGAVAFLDRLNDPAENWEWRFVELPAVSPFGFPLFASRLKESFMLEDPDAAVERLYRELQAHCPPSEGSN